MTSYQATMNATQPRPASMPTITRRGLSRAISIVTAVAIALLFLVVSMELTMGYGLDQPGQPDARPVPGLGL